MAQNDDILVRFSKHGFYHPAFGRMGRGRQVGDVYRLPVEFKASGMLPKDATILEDIDQDEMDELLEDQGQRRPHKPKVVDEDALKKAKQRAGKTAPTPKKAAK